MTKLRVLVGPEDHAQGDADAEVTLVEYGDYECPHCASAHPVVKRLQQHFGKKLRFVFRNFPLSQIHPHAEAAAETAEFAGAQSKFWEMHDQLLKNQNLLGQELFEELAEDIGLSKTELREASENKTYEARVLADFSGGVRSGVNGTPTFFINGQRNNGPNDYDYLVNAIDESKTSV